MNKLLVLTFLLISGSSFACEFESLDQISIATSLKNKRSFFFNEKKAHHDKSVVRAFNCNKLALSNKYLMIANGPQIIEFDDSIKSFSYTDNIRPSNCTIENAPYELMSFEEKKKLFVEKKNYFKNCVETYIEDEGNMPLNIKEDQPGCTVKKINTHKAVFSGGFCFVKPNFTSTYLIKTRIKKECTTYEGVKKLGVQPMDLKGNVNYYASGDDSGSSIQLEALDSIPVRIITNAESDFMESSDDFGLDHPTFPTSWVDVKPFVAQPFIQFRGDYVIFKPKFFVDNRCARKCKNGICHGECDFATPVVANIALKAYSEKKEKYEYLTSWIDGGVAQPGYQGLITGAGFNIPSHYINEKDNFRLVFEFDDPKFDFERFKNHIVRKYGRIEQHLPRLGRSDISKIPDINEIREQALLPQIRVVDGLNFDRRLDGLSSALDTLRQYLNYKVWPPYYSRLCDRTLQNCKDIKANYIKIIVDFKLKKNGMNYKMLVKEVTKKDIFTKQKYKNNKLPALKCGF
ncbi:MAG: hypothetical protein N4A33_10340 [Bacteriovoracaceae bacterium]|jgi:hypothetical protein|nr:hypothetical protein [Bacteriovoracaceae bacterium]